MGDTSDHRVERLNGTGAHPVPWHDAGYETPKAPGWCVSADGRQAFERLVFRYGDPQWLERDLAGLAELRRRVAELSGASGVTVPRRFLWRLPDYALHRLGWGLFWRLGGFALVQLVWLPQVEWLALVGGPRALRGYRRAGTSLETPRVRGHALADRPGDPPGVAGGAPPHPELHAG